MKALCVNDEGLYGYVEVGEIYDVVEHYVCMYGGNERIVIETETGYRDFSLNNFGLIGLDKSIKLKCK